MSIENITASILNDAKQNAEASRKSAEKTADEIIKTAKNDAEAIKKAAQEKAQRESENLKSRKVSAAELQGRKMMLGAKQEAIKKSFDSAIERLSTMPENEYIEYLTEEIIKVPNCEGTIILNKRDKGKVGKVLIKAINDKLNGEKFTLSKDTINSKGGFVLRSGNIEINNTFEALLDSMKDELTNEVASTLFK